MCDLSVDDIKLAIDNSPDFAIKCLLTIYDNQTQDEKQVKDTKHYNNIGFTGADGYILSSFSEQVLNWQNTPENQRQYKYPLSYKQFNMMKKKMIKYAKQLENYLEKEE